MFIWIGLVIRDYEPLENAIVESKKDEQRLARTIDHCRKRLKELGYTAQSVEVAKCCLKMIIQNHRGQHLFSLNFCSGAVEKCAETAKNSALILRGRSASQKSVLFFVLFSAMPP